MLRAILILCLCRVTRWGGGKSCPKFQFPSSLFQMMFAQSTSFSSSLPRKFIENVMTTLSKWEYNAGVKARKNSHVYHKYICCYSWSIGYLPKCNDMKRDLLHSVWKSTKKIVFCIVAIVRLGDYLEYMFQTLWGLINPERT